MAVFSYQARSMNGTIVEGQIDAANEQEARVKIRANRLLPIKVSVGAGGLSAGAKSFQYKARARKVKGKDLQNFTRQLSVLIAAGVPIIPSLEALSQGTKSKSLKAALYEMAQDISTGKKLGESFGRQSHVFDRFYVNMVIAGEEGGVLEGVLKRVADYIEKSVKIQGKIKGALVYPIAVLVISFLVISGLLIYVVPKFAELFNSNGMELPLLTKLVMSASEFMQKAWYIILGVIIGSVVGLRQYYATPNGRATIDSLLLRAPLFGNLIIKGGLARFTRTLSTLLGAGVPIMDAMDIASQVSGNYVLEKSLLKAKESIAAGKSIAAPFAQEKIFPPLVVQMMSVGEATGALDQMLEKVADFFEDEVDNIVSGLTSLIEPIMIVVLGGIVAFLVLAMYMPIFQMAGAGAGG
ncbi:MAG: type II secretion system F family protein [Bdellovibrionaceae bacterium]|nr:type II secretion system F family protein [Pseudobdellovibrionaceae bacterium]